MSWPGPVAPWEQPPPDPHPHTPRLPHAWLLALLVLLAWWPLNPWWQSDDFLALAYAHDLSRALSDFTGPQYGAESVWLFYRPLITLSFWLDQQLGVLERAPWLAHLSNALAHALSSVLVAAIWSRFTTPRGAWFAGLLWGLLPSHAGAVLWTAGRVDSHTTVWILLSLWLLCRARENTRHASWLSLLAFALALMSKELAAVTPALAFLLLLAHGRGTTGERVLRALRGIVPFAILLALWLGLRQLLLGTAVGGYGAARFDPGPMVLGLAGAHADVLNPLRYAGHDVLSRWLGTEPPPFLTHLAWLPPALAAVLAVVHRRAAVGLLALAAWLLACIPMAPFWSADTLQNLRYWYLPTAALLGIFAAGGIVPSLLALAVLAAPFVAVRESYLDAHTDMGRRHRALLREVREVGVENPVFVENLPVRGQDGLTVQFHHGVDRLLQPPFLTGDPARALPLRPVHDHPRARRLWAEGDVGFALPDSTTFFFEGPSILGKLPSRSLPDCPAELTGITTFTTEALDRLAATDGRHDHPDMAWLVTPGTRGPHYRVTLFTSIGYMSVILPDQAPDGAADGRVSLYDLLSRSPFVTEGFPLLYNALEYPVALDLVPRFPVLVEAGTVRQGAERTLFTPERRARTLMHWTFDRDYSDWLDRLEGR